MVIKPTGLGGRVKRRRTELKLSQKQLARTLGVTQGAVAQMELGLRLPSLDVLPRLAKALDVTADVLLSGEDSERLEIGALDAGDRALMRRFLAFLLWERKR
jgi:transcriptional regulator with XRE-family HTH domain